MTKSLKLHFQNQSYESTQNSVGQRGFFVGKAYLVTRKLCPQLLAKILLLRFH